MFAAQFDDIARDSQFQILHQPLPLSCDFLYWKRRKWRQASAFTIISPFFTLCNRKNKKSLEK
jgi:hypothetical protein